MLVAMVLLVVVCVFALRRRCLESRRSLPYSLTRPHSNTQSWSTKDKFTHHETHHEKDNLATPNPFLTCVHPPHWVRALHHGILTTPYPGRQASSQCRTWEAQGSCHAQQEANPRIIVSDSRSFWHRSHARGLRRPDEPAGEEQICQRSISVTPTNINSY